MTCELYLKRVSTLLPLSVLTLVNYLTMEPAQGQNFQSVDFLIETKTLNQEQELFPIHYYLFPTCCQSTSSRYKQLPEKASNEEPSQINPSQSIADPIPGQVPETIIVERFEFDGNTVISDEDLTKATEGFLNRPLQFTEVFEVRAVVTSLYQERGYITSGAIIPPQTFEGDAVKIQVVETGLEAINVTGTRRLHPNYVRSRVALATETPLNRDNLLEALRLLQLDPLIENVSAELSAGTKAGNNLLTVEITEAKTFSIATLLSNNRSPSVGTFQRRVEFTQANLFGRGDGLSIGYSNTDGSNTIDASYSFPINPRNGTLSFEFSDSSGEVVEPPFDRIDLDVDSRYFALTMRQPLVKTLNSEFALGLSATRQESELSVFDIPARISPGADEEGRTRISALRFFQEWTQRKNREVFAARSQFSLGLDLFGETEGDNNPDNNFFSWRGQVQWARLLASDTLLLLRADAQLSAGALVPLEQLALGGQDTIRGYRQNVLLTDNGLLASAEIRLPILRLPKQNALVQIAPFVDFGTGWNDGDNPEFDPDPSTLISTGIGLRFQFGNRLSVRLDWGIPLVEAFSRDRSLQEDGLYFSILSFPF
ncbi:MAG: ShlB/FhaC/HecB family hemolysin secretion/activation protein [Symploca sp. SIO2B6]|nr:ShlB/FhaC/HecB family hemolysin secretion/activation protein [Symploca sp. SIO2B6]